MMYYGRGIQMKEWYLTPSAMSEDKWKSLATIHRWSERNFKALANNIWIGGRPDEGHAYGYVGWDGERGVLVARNPGPAAQVLRVAFDPAAGFSGKDGAAYQGRVVYPYHATLPDRFMAGRAMEIEIPGYETLAIEFAPGTSTAKPQALPVVVHTLTAGDAKAAATVEVPADLAGRGDLLVIGYPELPEVRIDGELVAPLRTSKAALNHFAGYAVAGMKSTKVREWRMASFDLSAKAGKKVSVELAGGERETRAEAWLLAERKAVDEVFETRDLPWAISAGSRRETVCLVPERPLRPTPVPVRTLSADERRGLRKAWLTIEHFGVSAGHGTKRLFLNGKELAVLPDGPDEWRKARIEVPVGAIQAANTLELRHDSKDDKFKFRGAELRVELADGSVVRSTAQSAAQTSFGDWVHLEGELFPAKDAAKPVALDFRAE
jgi:hypothetical protein